MKHLFEGWRRYIKEAQAPKKLLKEFDNKDRDSLMDIEERFSVSYEIELESHDPIGESGEERIDIDRARNFLNEDYFYENATEREAEYALRYGPSGIEDEEDLASHFLDEEGITVGIRTGENHLQALYAAISFEDTPDYLNTFFDLLQNMLGPETPLNPAITQYFIEKIGEKKLEQFGVKIYKDAQTSLPFSSEEPHTIYRSQNLRQFISKYFYNLDSDAPYNIEEGVDFGISDILEALEAKWEGPNQDLSLGGDLYTDADTILGSILEPSKWSTVGHLIHYSGYSKKDSPLIWSIQEMVSNLAEEWAQKAAETEYEEYQDDPIDYLENMGYDTSEFTIEAEGSDFESLLFEHLPNFMNEYADQLKFESDASLTNGVEFSMDNPLYMTGLEEAFKFLEIFFKDYNNQNNFFFDSNTGLHTNIGYLPSDENIEDPHNIGPDPPNLIKGLLFLNDKFAKKGFESRKHSRWARDLKAAAKKHLAGKSAGEIEQYMDLLRGRASLNRGAGEGADIAALEGILSSEVMNAARKVGTKALGMNITYVHHSEYVEFRYPGNTDPTYDRMVDATYYYSHIVRTIFEKDYKRESYLRKLYGFISNLEEYPNDPAENTKKLKGMLLAGVGTIYSGAITRDRAPKKEYEELLLAVNIEYGPEVQTALQNNIPPTKVYATRDVPLIYGGLRRVAKGKTKKSYVVTFYRPIIHGNESLGFKEHIFSLTQMINGKVNDFHLMDAEFVMTGGTEGEKSKKEMKRNNAMSMMGYSTDPDHLEKLPFGDEKLIKLFSDWKQALYKWRASNEEYTEKLAGVFE
jgi:hypothetical protein